MTALGIVAFVVALLVSVMIHEAGHFAMARRFGMKATQFFVGFGPTLWSRQRGETEYGIKAIPAGGFVKIVGMTPLEEVDPADEERAFYRQPAGRKAIVLAAGSVMHFVIAVLLVFGVTFAVGVADDEAPVLSAPTACVPLEVTTKTTAAPACPGPEAVPGPAAAAGLRDGDRVLVAGGQPIRTYREFVTVVRAHPGKPLKLRIDRAGDERTITLTPVRASRPDLDNPTRQIDVGAIGVTQALITKRLGPVDAVAESGDRLAAIVSGTYRALSEKLPTIARIYGDDRDREGVVGPVGAARVSGEVLAAEEFSLAVRVSDFLLLIAGLNLFVGVFNLLPLLPLDGGHLAVVGYEQARHKIRRARGYRGAIRRVDMTKLLPLTYAVVLLFIGATIWIMGADIVNPVRLSP